jgi:hypothetical protein
MCQNRESFAKEFNVSLFRTLNLQYECITRTLYALGIYLSSFKGTKHNNNKELVYTTPASNIHYKTFNYFVSCLNCRILFDPS